MKKVAVFLIITFMCMQIGTMSVLSASNDVATGIRKYKEGNYTGCIEWMTSIIKSDPSNSVAYYYIAMSYVQAGRKDDAVDNYNKVISLNTNPLLTDYANHGKLCLEDPEKCKAEPQGFDKFIEGPFNNGLSKALESDIKKREIENIRKKINTGKEIPQEQLQEYRNFSSQNKTGTPTNDEIVAALRVLQRAGLQSYGLPNPVPNQYNNPQISDISAFLGQNNSMGGNSLMNMLPYLQNNNGMQANPQLIQTMMMNQMIPDFSNNGDRR